MFHVEKYADEPELRLPLEPCQRYVVGVSQMRANGTSQTPMNWLRVKLNNIAPPSNPNYTLIGNSIQLTWEHNCHLEPASYLITIHDFTLNRSITTQINGLKFNYRMAKGGNYRFQLRTPFPNAISEILDVTALPLPIPQGFNAIAMAAQRNAYEFQWRPVRLHGET